MAVTYRQLLIAVVAPMALMIIYTLISRWPLRWFSTTTDYIAIGVAAVIGVSVIAKFNISPFHKVLFSLLYAPFIAAALFGVSVATVCVASGDCL